MGRHHQASCMVIKSQGRHLCKGTCWTWEFLSKPSTCHNSQERHVWGKKGTCGSGEDLNRADTCHKNLRTSFWPKKKRLRQRGRPQQACRISENPRTAILAEKKRLRQLGRPHPRFVPARGIVNLAFLYLAEALFESSHEI